jgi:flavin reductase (DIM6/NTAB) family NADH-FMN oxidoreductase RutF
MAYLGKSDSDWGANVEPLRSWPHEGDAYRLAMRELAGGVTVISTGAGANRSGCTATSVTSLSLEPPSLIVCMQKTSSTLKRLRATRRFAVNMLPSGRGDLADLFAGRSGVSGAARFHDDEWTTFVTGAPVLQDALAVLDCVLQEVIERHTHAIVIGRVVATRRHGGPGGLVHWRGGYENVGERK